MLRSILMIRTLLLVSIPFVIVEGTTTQMPPTPAPSVSPDQTTTTSPTPSPSASPTKRPPPSTKFPTVSPTPSPTTTTTTLDDSLALLDNHQKPFDKCKGPCDNDDDCVGTLRCQQRSVLEPVAGCNGAGERATNYCYDPQDGLAAPQLPTGPMRLRQYWEEGYLWQESPVETFWCLDERGGGIDQKPRVYDCPDVSTRYEVVYLETGDCGHLIKVSDKDLCLERTGSIDVTYQSCNQTSPEQRWLANWESRRFDIRPIGKRNKCLTQHHHPKRAEIVKLEDCWTAHFTYTGNWEIY